MPDPGDHDERPYSFKRLDSLGACLFGGLQQLLASLLGFIVLASDEFILHLHDRVGNLSARFAGNKGE